ncbi:hypothetical protein Tco_0760594 [Tanacetum coccineum]
MLGVHEEQYAMLRDYAMELKERNKDTTAGGNNGVYPVAYAIVEAESKSSTEYQLADMFTKALPEDRFKYLVRRIGMRCLTPTELEVLTNEPT